ncbi:hypothetical protein ES703_40755 [subsurface metagenome]
MTVEKTATKEHKDYWSEDSQVFFTTGKGYGLTEELKTICLGTEEDILRAFNTGELNPNLSPLQRQLLLRIIEFRREEGIGDIGAKSLERAGVNGITGRKQKAARHIKARKRAAIRPARQKRPVLSRR